MKKYFTFIFAITITLIVLICFYSLLATPIADDWSFFTSTKVNSFLDFLGISMEHTGRLGQWSVIWIGFKIFGWQAIKLLPLFIYFSLSFLLSVSCHNFKIFNKSDTNYKLKCLVGGFLTTAIVLHLFPSMFDSFLWYDSSASYMLSLIFMMINVNLIFLYFNKDKKWFLPIIIISMFVGQLFNELTSIASIVIFGCLLLYSIFIKNKEKIIKTIIMIVPQIIGFFLMYFSPGSVSRRKLLGFGGKNFEWIFKDSLEGFNAIFGTWEIWQWFLLFVLISYFIIFCSKKKNFNKISLKFLLVAVLILFIFSTYGMFVINNFAQDYMPYRVFTLPVFLIIISFIVATVIFARIFWNKIELFLKKITSKKHKILFNIANFFVVISLIFGSMLTLYNMSKYITNLSLRKQLLVERDASVRSQLENKEDKIYVSVAPILVRGNAEDFYYYEDENGSQQIIWVAKNYAGYMNIPIEKLILVDPPQMYTINSKYFYGRIYNN